MGKEKAGCKATIIDLQCSDNCNTDTKRQKQFCQDFQAKKKRDLFFELSIPQSLT
jgi:hypothetical protein